MQLVHEQARTYVAGEITGLEYVRDLADRNLEGIEQQIEVFVKLEEEEAQMAQTSGTEIGE